MRIARLSAHNIKGFQDFSIECGDVNLARGKNGSNKTSVMCLVTGLFGKGNPRMLRAGADSGFICAVIEGDGETWEVTRSFEPGRVKTPVVKSDVTGKVSAGVDFLKSIMDSISIDPLARAMNASEEEQSQILLDTIPLTVDVAELSNAVAGVDAPGLQAVLKNSVRLSGLDAIKAVYDHVYDHRRNVNRDSKTKAVHAAQLLESLPQGEESEVEINWQAEAKRLLHALQTVTAAESHDREEAQRAFTDLQMQLEQERAAAIQEIDAEINKQIRALEKERADRKSTVIDTHRGKIDLIQAAHQKNLDDIAAERRPVCEQLTAEHAVAMKHASEQSGHTRTRQIAEQAATEALALDQKSDAMTAALRNLDEVRARLLENLPIKGMTMEAGIIYLDGVPLSEKNTAERAKFWLRIGAMRAGDLGVICVDGAECFDDETMAAVIQAMKNTGLQWFVGRVDNEPFRVERIAA